MTGVPPIDPGALPPAVRAAGPDAVDRLRSALGFERVLLGELLDVGLATGDGPLAASLPDALADGIVASGGIGVGLQLYESLGPDDEPATGGRAA